MIQVLSQNIRLPYKARLSKGLYDIWLDETGVGPGKAGMGTRDRGSAGNAIR